MANFATSTNPNRVCTSIHAHLHCLKYVSALLSLQNAEADGGRIGLIIVLCGMGGSMVCGFILDKTHAYK